MAAKTPTATTEWQLTLRCLQRGERVEVGDHPVAVKDRKIIQLSSREHRGRRRTAQQVSQLPSAALTKEQGRELSGRQVWRSERRELGHLAEHRIGNAHGVDVAHPFDADEASDVRMGVGVAAGGGGASAVALFGDRPAV